MSSKNPKIFNNKKHNHCSMYLFTRICFQWLDCFSDGEGVLTNHIVYPAVEKIMEENISHRTTQFPRRVDFVGNKTKLRVSINRATATSVEQDRPHYY